MRILRVSEFIEVVNVILREAWQGEDVGVEGEVSGFRVSQGQWVSFDLKDENALVNVFLPVWNLSVPLEDGMRVRVVGYPRVYPKYGKFSLSAERIELVGEGALRKALAALRARLEKEGMFELSRKRTLPRFPERIALIASTESAAYGDFMRVVKERWGGLEIDVYHVLVQGERAPREIVAAIEQAGSGDYDVLVMTRGGGSFEELMAFNDEQVVRALFACPIPTLVAIGHERDVTLAEEVADVRGSTPTDSARRLVPDRQDVAYELASLTGTVESALRHELDRRQAAIEHAVRAPSLWLTHQRVLWQRLTSQSILSVQQWHGRLKQRVEAQCRLLESFDPSRVLQRGYSLVQDDSGATVTTVTAVQPGTNVTLRFHDGTALAGIHSRMSST